MSDETNSMAEEPTASADWNEYADGVMKRNPAMPSARAIPFPGFDRLGHSSDPDLDPSISHPCHCLRCDGLWNSEPGKPFPPKKCAKCRSASWMTFPDPIQQVELAERNRKLKEAHGSHKAARRRFWLAHRMRQIVAELGEDSREVMEMAREASAADRLRKAQEDKARELAREQAVFTRREVISTVVDTLGLLPPPPPPPMSWDVRKPIAAQPPTADPQEGGNRG
jgi:hypothetical protein